MQKINILKRLKDFRKKSDGTYDLITGKLVEFDTGYMVTFHWADKKYTEKEYRELCDKFQKQTESKIYAGVYGEPEASFHTDNFILAYELAKEYNQKSIWDCGRSVEIENEFYDESKGNKIRR